MKKNKKILITIALILVLISGTIFILRDKIFKSEDTNYKYLVFDNDDKAYLKNVEANFAIEVEPDGDFSYEIVDSNGEEVDTILKKKKDYSIIKPKSKYEEGEEYTLTITNGVFKKEELKSKKTITFKVKRKEVAEFTYNANVSNIKNENISVSNDTLKTTNKYQVDDIIIIDNKEAYKIVGVNRDNTYKVEIPSIEEIFKDLDIYEEGPLDLSNIEIDDDLEKYLVAVVKESHWYDNLVETVNATPEISYELDKSNLKNGVLEAKLNVTIPAGDDANFIEALKKHDLTFALAFKFEVTHYLDGTLIRGIDFAINLHEEDSISFNIDYVDASLANLDSKSREELDKLLNIFSTADLDVDKGEFAKILGTADIPLGTSGFFFSVNLKAVMDYNFKVDAGYNIKNAADITFGFSWKPLKGFSSYGNSSRRSLENHAYLGGSGNITLGLNLDAGISFLNIVSASLNGEAGGYAKGEFMIKAVGTTNTQDKSEFKASGEAGWYFKVGLKLEAVGLEKTYNLYDKKEPIYSFDFDANKNNTENDSPVSGEAASISDEKIKRLYSTFSDDTGEYYTTYISKKSTKVSDLSDKEKLEMTFRSIPDNEYKKLGKYEGDWDDMYVPKTIVDKYYQKAFNNNEYKPVDFGVISSKEYTSKYLTRSACGIKYNSSTKNFEVWGAGVGGFVGVGENNIRFAKLVDAYYEGEYLYLIEHQVLATEVWVEGSNGEPTLDHVDFYKDLDKKVPASKNVKFKWDYTNTYKEYQNYIDKGGTVKIVLKNDGNGNYYFVESIIENS